MAIKILKIQQNSEEWLTAREGKVTGSIADNLLTRGLEDTLKQNYSRFRGNFYTQRGHVLEDEAIELYEAIHDTTVERPGLVTNTAYPNCACSPDGLDGDWLLEVKAFGQPKHCSITNVTKIPFKIMAQLQFNMMICHLPHARLILYNPDIEDDKLAYREIEVPAQATIQRNLKIRLNK